MSYICMRAEGQLYLSLTVEVPTKSMTCGLLYVVNRMVRKGLIVVYLSVVIPAKPPWRTRLIISHTGLEPAFSQISLQGPQTPKFTLTLLREYLPFLQHGLILILAEQKSGTGNYRVRHCINKWTHFISLSHRKAPTMMSDKVENKSGQTGNKKTE
jgi:hypothetical protein